MKRNSLLLLSIFSVCSISSLVALEEPEPSASRPESIEQPEEEQPIPPPEVIERQLAEAEKEFQEAKEMFNPWYSGPLLTGSAHTVPPGHVNIQGYLFVTDNYARYDDDGSTNGIPDLIVYNPVLNAQAGVVDWMSVSFNAQTVTNRQRGHSRTNIGDTSLGLNFALWKESAYDPAVSFRVTETFPTGKYQNLNTHRPGLSSTGAGSYQTTFSFNVSKVVWWIMTHPMAFRTSLNYTVLSNVDVHNFNTYGGGFGTNGTVNPGSNFSGNLAWEYSFTQRWVFAVDAVYSYSWKTTFRGDPGLNRDGTVASVGGPDNQVLSFAPALEYNFSSNFGFVGGVWFSAWGRNTLAFISGIVSATYTW